MEALGRIIFCVDHFLELLELREVPAVLGESGHLHLGECHALLVLVDVEDNPLGVLGQVGENLFKNRPKL